MNTIFYVISNLKHNGDLLAKGTFFEAPLAQFEHLVADGVLRVMEDVSSIAEATKVIADEEAQAIRDAEEASGVSAPSTQDTWGPAKEENTPATPAEEIKPAETTDTTVKTETVAPGAVGEGDKAPTGDNL